MKCLCASAGLLGGGGVVGSTLEHYYIATCYYLVGLGGWVVLGYGLIDMRRTKCRRWSVLFSALAWYGSYSACVLQNLRLVMGV